MEKTMKKPKHIADKPVYKDYIKGGKIELTESEDKMDQVDAMNYIEKEYPETAAEFHKIQFEQWSTFCKKQMDYGPSNISMGTALKTKEDRRLSLIGLIVRINDKIQRLMNLVFKHNRTSNQR